MPKDRIVLLLLLWLQGSFSFGDCFTIAPRAPLFLGRGSSFLERRRSSFLGLKQEETEEVDHQDGGKGPDLFDYFDPLLSPHAYPNGISPRQKPATFVDPLPQTSESIFLQQSKAVEDWIPVARSERKGSESSSSMQSYFDPTLSPHTYAQGTPRAVIGDHLPSTSTTASRGSWVLGILLIDHGSRNTAANQRLDELAALYQQSMASTAVVVAAHMELANPSIQEGMEELVKSGVDEIVCHPYFLSPDGRHVREDIPRLVDEAIQALQVQVPVRTTEAVGSDMNVMLEAIHALVQKESSLLNRF